MWLWMRIFFSSQVFFFIIFFLFCHFAWSCNRYLWCLCCFSIFYDFRWVKDTYEIELACPLFTFMLTLFYCPCLKYFEEVCPFALFASLEIMFVDHVCDLAFFLFRMDLFHVYITCIIFKNHLFCLSGVHKMLN